MNQKVKNKHNFMQHCHCFGKSKIHMYVHNTEYELCHFSGAMYTLNTPTFAFKIGIVQCKDE